MRHFVQLTVLSAIALLLSLAAPSAVQAAYPCPGGPGPGEVQVGVSGGTHGVAAVPICDRAGGGAPQAPPTYSYVYGAIAAHPDAADVWMAGGYSQSYGAEREAMAMCAAAMGDGCISFGEWHNSSFAIIRDARNYIRGAWNGQGGAMRKRVLKECAAEQLLPCEVVGSFSSSKRRHQPSPATYRKSYIAAAWVFGEGYDNRLYISSGQNRYADAERQAIDACARATGRKCQIAAMTANGVIQPFRLGDGSTSVASELSAKRAAQAMKADCKKRKTTCTAQRPYDSRTAGQFVHDFVADAAPAGR